MRVADLLEDAAMFEVKAKRALAEFGGADDHPETMAEAVETMLSRLPDVSERYIGVRISLRFNFEVGCAAEAATFARSVVDGVNAQVQTNRYTVEDDDDHSGVEDLVLEAWEGDHVLGEINLLTVRGGEFLDAARNLNHTAASMTNNQR